MYGMEEMDVDWIVGIEENRIENAMESTIKYYKYISWNDIAR